MVRILIADDNKQNLVLLERLLTKSGYEVALARNGAEALAIAELRPPDLIITDVLMPVMDGFELCHRWKSDDRFKNIPFVFFTATYTDPKGMRLGLSMGADLYIVKPQDPETLVQAIRDVLEQHSQATSSETQKPFGDELEYFRRYNEVLFDKLEKKMIDMTRLNKELEHEIAVQKKFDVERSRLMDKVQSSCDEVVRANRAKDLFLATLSHELRTPLTSVLGWAQLLRMERVSIDQFPEVAAKIEKSALEQKRLIDELLDISMILCGRLPLEPVETDLATVVKDQMDSFRALARINGIDVTTEIESLPEKAIVDPFRIKQVVANLIENALKFTPRGGKVHVVLIAQQGKLALSVSDTGIGIRREWLSRIFEPFQLVDSSKTRRHRGLGLGLAIVKSLVEAMRGTVWAESAGEGSGATFHVELPLIAEPSSISGKPVAEASRMQVAMPCLTGKTVLLVDDDQDTLETVGELLKSFGLQVKTASSARQAIAVIRVQAPDILVSDIAMPEEDGYTLIQQVRSEAGAGTIKSFPAVALTAFADSDTYQQALCSGYAACAPKPIESVVGLLGILAAALSSPAR